MGGFLGGAPAGGLKLLERKAISGAAVTSTTFSGLAGDTELVYLLLGKVTEAAGSAANIELIFNGTATSATDCQRINAEGATIAAVRVADETPLAQVSANGEARFSAIIWAATGELRGYYSQCAQDLGAAIINRLWSGSWDDTSTEVTSLQVLSNQTNGIGVGSAFELYQLATS